MRDSLDVIGLLRGLPPLIELAGPRAEAKYYQCMSNARRPGLSPKRARYWLKQARRWAVPSPCFPYRVNGGPVRCHLLHKPRRHPPPLAVPAEEIVDTAITPNTLSAS